MDDWMNTAIGLMKILREKGFPESVVETAAGAIDLNRDKAKEIRDKVLNCKTPKEVVKAVQMYL